MAYEESDWGFKSGKAWSLEESAVVTKGVVSVRLLLFGSCWSPPRIWNRPSAYSRLNLRGLNSIPSMGGKSCIKNATMNRIQDR